MFLKKAVKYYKNCDERKVVTSGVTYVIIISRVSWVSDIEFFSFLALGNILKYYYDIYAYII